MKRNFLILILYTLYIPYLLRLPHFLRTLNHFLHSLFKSRDTYHLHTYNDMVSFFTVLCSLTTFSTILKSSEICRQMQFYHLEYFVYFTFRRKSFRRNNFYPIISFPIDFQISSLPKIQKPTKKLQKMFSPTRLPPSKYK